MNGTQNLNLNECFKEISNIGSTTFQNICDGTSSTVPWGSAGWVAVLIFVSLFGLVIFMFGSIITNRY